MAGIPPTIETDSEDVAWALQTADALWKRDERLDAIVWLRRAAQAAGDADDDDRALVLARNAAELADWMGRGSAPSPQPLPHPPPQRDSSDLRVAGGGVVRGRSPVPAALVNAAGASLAEMSSPTGDEPYPGGVAVGPTPRPGETYRRDDEATSPDITLPVATPMPALSTPRPKWLGSAPLAMPSVVPTLKPGRVTGLPPAPPLPAHRALAEEPSTSGVGSAHVPTAAEVHAGMLDPWAEAEAPAHVRDPSEDSASRLENRPSLPREPDDVVTSAPPVSERGARQPSPATMVSSAVAPGRVRLTAPRQSSTATPPPSAPQPSRPGAATAPQTPPEPQPPPGRVDEFGIPLDWPESSRRALSRAASVRELASDEEVSGFALVSVLQGAVDVAATIVDAPAERLHAGSMLRARGTIDAAVPLRVIAATGGCRVATWNEKQVTQALAPCPEVEEALRGAGNRIQALVGATMGPLGERLDTALRAEVTSRLRVRIIAEHELVAKAGQPVPGLLVIGSGELEPLGKSGTPEGPALRSGDFLFPTEVLRAATAPRSVRGAKGGALVLTADRVVAQELLVTFPLLLEIFAEA